MVPLCLLSNVFWAELVSDVFVYVTTVNYATSLSLRNVGRNVVLRNIRAIAAPADGDDRC